ncbi:LOW QUALITY PROTEIN: clustered mitochondria protein homolog [Scylla paramamosain]|uniref:LOW QUALITY PROTEIN: clustered mitochondria protein homolog n=1 Tax=Scylla paramamosain TaxID=85552 RepID=UPI003083BF20
MAQGKEIENGPQKETEKEKEGREKRTLMASSLKDGVTNGVLEEEEKAERETQEKMKDGGRGGGGEEEEEEEDKKKKKKEEEEESLGLQEYGFTVKIKPPTGDIFEIQVSSMELVYEIHQLLMDREDTCQRTCFSLHLDGNILDNFAELKSIEGLTEGSVIRVQEEPYTVREARIHVRHVRDLLKSLEPIDAYNGIDCASLSFLHVVTQGDILGESYKKKGAVESVDCTPPKYILPNSKERPLLPLQPFAKEHKSPQCLKVLTISGWNPPPGPRKLHGDLLYLSVVTLEGRHHHITASTWGFYLNQTTEGEFNPKPANPCYLCHSLIDLLNTLSPGFKRNFANLQKKRSARHPFERVATPYQVYTWAAPPPDHGIDALRAEDAYSSKLGYEEHIPGQTRDWNEELQTTRELPRRTLAERLVRERAMFKVHSDFVAAATRGAMAVIDGNVMAINPGEDPKMQMYIWNNIFFSLGFDVRDHYKEVGGDAAAHVAPRNDLQGVRVYGVVDQEGLYTLGTAVVDYRGYRVTAQSIIPGILEREQEQSVVYGSIDFGKTVVSHDKYLELLRSAGQTLKVLPHSVLNDKGQEVELCSSVECKGIIGNDGRHYILDLLRTFPPDINFLPGVEGAVVGDAARTLGFPMAHCHKLATLRQELVDAFVDNRYMTFLKMAALHLQRLRAQKEEEVGKKKKEEEEEEVEASKEEGKEEKKENKEKEDKEKEEKEEEEKEKDEAEKEDEKIEDKEEEERVEKEDGEKESKEFEAEAAKKMVESARESLAADTGEENTRNVIRSAAAAVGSLKETDFDIRFNLDAFSPGVRHPPGAEGRLAKERRLICDAADFLVEQQIPGLLADLSDHNAAPMDGAALCHAMHARGINIRYLGVVAERLGAADSLGHLHSLAVGEVVTRCARHVLRGLLQAVEAMSLACAVAHFLNCYLSSCVSPHAAARNEELLSKRRRRRPPFSGGGSQWASMTPRSLWAQLRAEAQEYYGFELQGEGVDAVVQRYGLQKVTLLRALCLKCGVQVLLRDYSLDGRQTEAFTEADVINLQPVVKHCNPRATEALGLYSAGQAKTQQGFLKDGYGLISEALALLNSVYGAVHPETAQCLRTLARLNYIMGDHLEALALQQKAVLMSERVNGIDHPQTVAEYVHLALYCFAAQQVSTALRLLYRARYLLLLLGAEGHPEMALVDSNIGLILHAVGQYGLSLQFLEAALHLNLRFHGSRSLKAAVTHHLVARTQSCLGDFRAALRHEKETFAIYRTLLGPDHDKTREADECLRHLTQQAVVMAKKISEAFGGGGGRSAAVAAASLGLPPVQIQPPSLSSVLDLLNVINGIMYVQITAEEIERLRAEIEKGQAQAAHLDAAADHHHHHQQQQQQQQHDSSLALAEEGAKSEEEGTASR